jgi:hypothetical protein
MSLEINRAALFGCWLHFSLRDFYRDSARLSVRHALARSQCKRGDDHCHRRGVDSVYSPLECAMSSSDRSVGSRSRRSAEQFREARLVRIARGTFAIGLDPLGMLDPQIVVNLLLELRIGVDSVIHGYYPCERFKCGAGRFRQRARQNRRLAFAP